MPKTKAVRTKKADDVAQQTSAAPAGTRSKSSARGAAQASSKAKPAAPQQSKSRASASKSRMSKSAPKESESRVQKSVAKSESGESDAASSQEIVFKQDSFVAFLDKDDINAGEHRITIGKVSANSKSHICA
jgi:hypothetical protein